jgi:phosphatidylethanolamine/phosphatidyl-N-methylethanolamine N-methyltransferase
MQKSTPRESSIAVFWRQFRQNFEAVGAVAPSSAALAQAMTARLAQKTGPARVLEAGAGTGAFTGQILSCLRPGDSCDIVEINPQLFTHLTRRFPAELPGVDLRWINDDIRAVDPGPGYDFIVFSLPLTNFPPALVQELLSRMVDSLRPSGTFSYVRYIFISRFKYAFGGKDVRAAMDSNQAIIEAFTSRYQVGRTAVLRNLPPAWVFYWQRQ